MKNENLMQKVKTGVKKGAKATGKYLYEHRYSIMTAVMVVVTMIPKVVYANGAGAGEAQWNWFVSLIQTWGTRFGGALLVFGLIETGASWSDNPAGKKQGIAFAISGIIVMVVCYNAPSIMG